MFIVTLLLWEMFTIANSKTCKVGRNDKKLNKCLQWGDVIIIVGEMSIFVCCGFCLQLRSKERSRVDTRWTYKMSNLKFVCFNLFPKLKNKAWSHLLKYMVNKHKVDIFADNWTWVFNFDVGFVFPTNYLTCSMVIFGQLQYE